MCVARTRPRPAHWPIGWSRVRREGLALRERLPAGALLVSGDGHVFTRHSVSFHAPDSELHGVLSRQREIGQLNTQLAQERALLAARRDQHAAAEAEFD